mmetsp:Transcript_993/g.1410  ORF Transcript_993/g.1410 Transcript_993/m.1410 type:complete len:89 (-) Transcript_993:621-887(-)
MVIQNLFKNVTKLVAKMGGGWIDLIDKLRELIPNQDQKNVWLRYSHAPQKQKNSDLQERLQASIVPGRPNKDAAESEFNRVLERMRNS